MRGRRTHPPFLSFFLSVRSGRADNNATSSTRLRRPSKSDREFSSIASFILSFAPPLRCREDNSSLLLSRFVRPCDSIRFGPVFHPSPAIERGFSSPAFAWLTVIILIFAVRTNGAPREENINRGSCMCVREKTISARIHFFLQIPGRGWLRIASVHIYLQMYIFRCIFSFFFPLLSRKE